MRILFDHGTPQPLIEFLSDHTVSTAKQMGWDTLSNGELLNASEKAEFTVLLTTDKNMTFQQNRKTELSLLWSSVIRSGALSNDTSAG